MTNEFKGHTGIDRIVRAAGHSVSGLRMAYAGESAFRREVRLAVPLLLCAGIWAAALVQRFLGA
jgi:diacylglycerol kinase (ATP)